MNAAELITLRAAYELTLRRLIKSDDWVINGGKSGNKIPADREIVERLIADGLIENAHWDKNRFYASKAGVAAYDAAEKPVHDPAWIEAEATLFWQPGWTVDVRTTYVHEDCNEGDEGARFMDMNFEGAEGPSYWYRSHVTPHEVPGLINRYGERLYLFHESAADVCLPRYRTGIHDYDYFMNGRALSILWALSRGLEVYYAGGHHHVRTIGETKTRGWSVSSSAVVAFLRWGLIEIERTEHDGRWEFYRLTEEGRAFYDRAIPHVERYSQEEQGNYRDFVARFS